MISELVAISCVALALRSVMSMNSFSGFNAPPMFGDYEAQRHWQEVTVNLDVKEWYTNGSNNDMQYWGLDYPPLTAYHSYLMGRVALTLNSSYVEIHTSRGIETKEHKSFMRLTVLAADMLVYLPAIFAICVCVDQTVESHSKQLLFFLFAIYPGQVLIDNGHFQYNNISLGLAAAAIAAILSKKYYKAALTFTLAVNYKQMELYHALPFFSYLLAACLSQKSFRSFIVLLTTISTIVLTVFAALWYPWLNSIDASLEVLYRLFPLGRGVFEDKVANFWCSINVIYKLKKHIVNNQMALICLGTTLLFALPSNIHLFWRRNQNTFLLTLFNTSTAFFLFSFQVHEKSILLVSLPALCLFNWWPKEILWYLEISVFSMLPLLQRDKLIVATLAAMTIFHLIFKCIYFRSKIDLNYKNELLNSIISISEILMIVIFVGSLIVKPSSKFPDIWALIISATSCIHIIIFFGWGYFQQFTKR